MTRPRPSSRCYDGDCQWWSPLIGDEGLRAWQQHHRAEHTEQHQLPSVTWREQAMLAMRALAARGEPFVISQVIDYGVPDAPNPRTDWSNIQKEAVALGWIEATGRLGHSVRPSTKGSPVTEWRGTYAARRVAAA